MSSSASEFSHNIQTARPGLATARFVQRYIQRSALIQGAYLSQPVPARVEQVVAFQFGDAGFVKTFQGIEKAANLVVAGPQTAGRSSLLLTGNIDAFYIFFRPAGIRVLFGISLAELSNRSYSGHALLGNPIVELYEQLAEASEFTPRVEIVERFLCRRIKDSVISRSERMIDRIVSTNGNISMNTLAADFSISSRQMERTFSEHAGMSPKLFARIVRFQAALAYKARSSEISWADAAQEFSYHDQMHLIHEFRKLSGDTLSGLVDKLAFLN